MRILLVEDDDMFGDATKTGLEQEAYAVDWTQDEASSIAALETQSYDIVLLDLGLPDGSGLNVLKFLRKQEKHTPVIIMTARDALNDKVSGLDMGADDYLVKPFDLHELYARIRAVWRRLNGQSISLLSYGALTLDPSALEVCIGDNKYNLGPKEFRILQSLVEHNGRIVSKESLEDALYSWGHEVESNAIEVHIHRIRKKLGKDIIKTVRGIGYKVE